MELVRLGARPENETRVIRGVRWRAGNWPWVTRRFVVDYVLLDVPERGRRCGSCSLTTKSDGIARRT